MVQEPENPVLIQLREIRATLAEHSAQFARTDERFAHIDKRFNDVGKRFDEMRLLLGHTIGLSTGPICGLRNWTSTRADARRGDATLAGAGRRARSSHHKDEAGTEPLSLSAPLGAAGSYLLCYHDARRPV